MDDKCSYIVKLGNLYFKYYDSDGCFLTNSVDNAYAYSDRSKAIERAKELGANVVEVKTTYKTVHSVLTWTI